MYHSSVEALLKTGVDVLHENFTALIAVLDERGEPSLRATADDNFRRSLLLASASYFETILTASVLDYAIEVSSPDRLLAEFVRIKGVERQYHSWFSWDDKHANQFFGLFGATFKNFMKRRLSESRELEKAMADFMELGRDRNRLVHRNFASFTLEKTADEIYLSYQSALIFVVAIPALLRECSGRQDD